MVSVAYTAEFDDDNDNSPDRTEARTSTQAPLSVQGLATAFKALAPFQAPAASLFQYNSTTHALTADLSMTIDPAPVTLPINVGSQLESETGVAGLQTTGGNVVADAGPISLDLKAGVFLLPEEDWDTVARAGGGCPDPSIVDPALCDDALNLFFVEVDPTGGEFSVADASFALSNTPVPSLSGQLGYLEVTASVPQFELGRADATAPVIRVDLTPQPGSMTVGGIAVPNAIPLRELLFDITGRTSVSPLNLKFEGDFDISASLNGANIGTAGVGVAWNPVLVGSPTITPDVNFDDLFANFNPVPNLFGTATNGTASTTVLETTGTTFTASAVGARLFNITDETSCEVSAFTATSLTCAEPLAGGADSQWDSGDLYRVEVGSPLAMLEILLDNLDQIVEAIDNVSGAGLGEALDTELPIVGVSPRSLLTPDPGHPPHDRRDPPAGGQRRVRHCARRWRDHGRPVRDRQQPDDLLQRSPQQARQRGGVDRRRSDGDASRRPFDHGRRGPQRRGHDHVQRHRHPGGRRRLSSQPVVQRQRRATRRRIPEPQPAGLDPAARTRDQGEARDRPDRPWIRSVIGRCRE